MDNDFFIKNELDDWNKLIKFNEKAHLFDTLERSSRYSVWDASGTSKNHKIIIELKQRNVILTQDLKLSGKSFIDDTIIIEDYKAAQLYLEGITNNAIPIYINFLADNTIIIHNLNRITSYRFFERTITSQGYGRRETCKRIGLHLNDATIYTLDGELIKGKNECK